MTFDQAIDYITKALKFGINPGLEKISAACSALGRPQERYPVIQITGTNGKTSTARMAAAVLREHGFKVGLYTSPHLSSYTERIAVNGVEIDEEDFAAAVSAVKPVLDQVSARMGELTEFEILTAAALNHFAVGQVDAAILEVGLGGRWDATSVSRPKISIVTNVDLDHADRLGNSIRKIAWDKAHIIKEDSVAIGGDLMPEALAQIESRCRAVDAELRLFGKDFRILDSLTIDRCAIVSIEGIFGIYRGLNLKVLGEFQRINAAVAIAACEAFVEGPLLESGIAKALSEVLCPGRMEIISYEPVVLVDGAHNPAGMRELISSLKESYGGSRLVVVLSVSSDKDLEGILSVLAPSVDRLILTQNKSYRSASVAELASSAGSIPCETEPDMSKAIERGLECANGGIVVVTGSLYAVGEARDIWAARATGTMVP
ncbi:MAG: bifunctional folylpolyglutamate synthase/dihydrofolate synthase [Actinobacteria bacterium]|nr:bifunctional folylpolyglutamate synthase/dihydrofolate synthase [Actinomycetota bacterium]